MPPTRIVVFLGFGSALHVSVFVMYMLHAFTSAFAVAFVCRLFEEWILLFTLYVLEDDDGISVRFGAP